VGLLVATNKKPLVSWIDDDEPAEVAAVSRMCFDPNEAMTEEFVLDFMDSQNHVPKVLRVGRRVVGLNFFVLYNKVVVIHQLAVLPNERGKGYGTKMINDMKESLPGLRRRIIAGDVCETRDKVHVWLRKREFEWFRTLKREGQPDRYAFKYIHPKG